MRAFYQTLELNGMDRWETKQEDIFHNSNSQLLFKKCDDFWKQLIATILIDEIFLVLRLFPWDPASSKKGSFMPVSKHFLKRT